MFVSDRRRRTEMEEYMKTIKLYNEMPYSTDFKATVIEVNKNEIILDQTLFFPQEGGRNAI